MIGYNGSKAAKEALYDLKRAAFPDETEALVLTVAESWLQPKTLKEAAAIADEAVDFLTTEFPLWQITSETVSGSPPREILARANSWKSDMIVLGEPLKTLGPGDIFIGHTSQTVLTEAECSVRIARGSETVNSSAARILVGYDGSFGAKLAVENIAARHWPANTEVRLLAVADSAVLTSIGRFTPQMSDAVVEAKFASQWAETLAAQSLELLKKAGIEASVEVRLGNPKTILVSEAEHWKADVIFVGPHCAPNSFERFLIGSVSSAVAARANCTVEIVR